MNADYFFRLGGQNTQRIQVSNHSRIVAGYGVLKKWLQERQMRRLACA
jgi:hypothetical protein